MPSLAWVMYVARAAFAMDPEGRGDRLVPARVANFQPQGLHASRTYIDLVDIDECNARAALLAGVQRERAKPKATPPFSAGRAALAPPVPQAMEGGDPVATRPTAFLKV